MPQQETLETHRLSAGLAEWHSLQSPAHICLPATWPPANALPHPLPKQRAGQLHTARATCLCQQTVSTVTSLLRGPSGPPAARSCSCLASDHNWAAQAAAHTLTLPGLQVPCRRQGAPHCADQRGLWCRPSCIHHSAAKSSQLPTKVNHSRQRHPNQLCHAA
jgi:hypothetical protein